MQTINAQQLAEMMERGDEFMLVNVLSEEQFQAHHVPGSRNVPVSEPDFVQRVEQMAGSRDRPVVVYCANTACTASPTAAKQLEEAGFTHVIDFEGGIEEWEQAQQPVEKGPVA